MSNDLFRLNLKEFHQRILPLGGKRLSTRKNFYQHIRHPGVYTITNCVVIFHFGSCIDLSLLFISAFSFLPSGSITISKKYCLMISMIVRVPRVNFKLCSQIYVTTDARYRCTMWNAATQGQLCLYIAAALVLTLPHLLKPMDFKVDLYLWLREIAKFSSTS